MFIQSADSCIGKPPAKGSGTWCSDFAEICLLKRSKLISLASLVSGVADMVKWAVSAIMKHISKNEFS